LLELLIVLCWLVVGRRVSKIDVPLCVLLRIALVVVLVPLFDVSCVAYTSSFLESFDALSVPQLVNEAIQYHACSSKRKQVRFSVTVQNPNPRDLFRRVLFLPEFDACLTMWLALVSVVQILPSARALLNKRTGNFSHETQCLIAVAAQCLTALLLVVVLAGSLLQAALADRAHRLAASAAAAPGPVSTLKSLLKTALVVVQALHVGWTRNRMRFDARGV
jgi:hypothetical protein